MAGKIEKTKGKIKVALGSLTGKKNLEAEGRLDRRAGQAKEKIGRAKDKVDAAAQSAQDMANKATDNARDAARPE
ncbi:MAG: CsbD family protein [Acidimicrobiales bacterium]